MEMFVDENQDNNSRIMRRSRQQRKNIYRNLLRKVQGIEESDDVGLGTTHQIKEVLRNANELESEWKLKDRVECADETFLDCTVVASASSILKKCVFAVDVITSTYDASEFSKNLINNVKNSQSDEELTPVVFLKLLDITRKIIPQVPVFSYICGTFDLDEISEPPLKKRRIRQPTEKLQRKEPEAITSLEKDEEGIENIVNVFKKVLDIKYEENNYQPIKYYEYIIDTDDFSTTVENIFYFSFLIRDGRAELDMGSTGDFLIKPAKKGSLKKLRDEGAVNAQIISQIKMAKWLEFKKPGFLQIYKRRNSK